MDIHNNNNRNNNNKMASRDSKKVAMEVSEDEDASTTSTGAGDVAQDKPPLTDSKHEHMDVAEFRGDITTTTTTVVSGADINVDETQSPGATLVTYPISATSTSDSHISATTEGTTQTVGGSLQTNEGTTQTAGTPCQGSGTQTQVPECQGNMTQTTELPTSDNSTQTAGTTTLTSASSTQTSPSKHTSADTARAHTDSSGSCDSVTLTPSVATGDQVDPGGVTTIADGQPSSTKQAEICDVDNSLSTGNVQPADSASENSDTVDVKVVEFKVIYNKQKYDVTFPVNKTVAQLKDHVQTLTGVPSPMQKIMYKGLAKDHSTLEELKVTKGAKIMVVGSTMNDVLAVNNAPSQKEIEQEAKAASSKEPLCQQKMHKKVLDKYSKPDDLMPGLKNTRQPLPPQPVSGMYNKSGGKVRLTFKLELDQVWLGTKERTEKLPMNSIKAVVSEAIDGHEDYHLMALQLGPTEASRYWIYWVPAQYVDAIKDTVLGKWQFF